MNYNAPSPVSDAIFTDGRAFGALMDDKGWTWEACNYWINMVFTQAYRPTDTFLAWAHIERKSLASILANLPDFQETPQAP